MIYVIDSDGRLIVRRGRETWREHLERQRWEQWARKRAADAARIWRRPKGDTTHE